MSNITNARAALALCTEDELADLAVEIVNCRFGGGAFFHECFSEALGAVDEAAARFRARNDHADAPSQYDFNRHPDDPFYGSRTGALRGYA